MRYRPIPAVVYKQIRKNFASELAPKSLAIFNSNDIYPISADSTLPFAQHRDIFYLCGVDQEESILVIFPDAFEENIVRFYLLKKQMITLPFGRVPSLQKSKLQN